MQRADAKRRGGVKRRAVALVALWAVAAAVLSGCARSPAGKPLRGDPEEGRELFTKAGCSACHSTGTDTIIGPGLKGVTTLRKPLPNGKPRTDANLMEWIRRGGTGSRGTMPSHTQLTDQELADLVAFLKTLR